MSAPERQEDMPAVGLDLLVVAVFAVLGRASHGESLAVGDVVHTALPFWAAALVTHLAFRFGRRSTRSPAVGAIVWLATWGGGILLRLPLGDTAEWPFVLVAGWILAAGLVGWRLVMLLAGRSPRRSRPTAP